MAGGWASLGLLDELVEVVENDFNWMLPTAVQDECIPLILGGGDVLASSETGSGKTAAFALPILQLCHEDKSSVRSRRRPRKQEGLASTEVDELAYEMSVVDRSKLVSIDPPGRFVQCRAMREWSGCRCAAGVQRNESSTKKFYYECEIMDDGIVRVGWATEDASLDLGTDSGGYGYGGTGMKAHNDKFNSYAFEGSGEKASFGKGDVIGCMLNFESGSISFSKNGRVVGKAFDIHEPQANRSGQNFPTLYPAISLKNAECMVNFGREKDPEFRHPPPESGFLPIGTLTKETGGAANPRANVDLQTDVPMKQGPLAIVIEPTRDLAQQTYSTFVQLSKRLPEPDVGTALLVGGLNPKSTLDMLKQGDADILVGTPPIIASYIKRKKINTRRCSILLLDEADHLLKKDTMEAVIAIFTRLPRAACQSLSAFDRLQVCFFSATLHSRAVKELTGKICHRPLWVDLRGKNDSIIPTTVHHSIVFAQPKSFDSFMTNRLVSKSDAIHCGGNLDCSVDWAKLSPEEAQSEKIKLLKPHILIDLLERFKMDSVLVFCRTNLDCDLLEQFLRSVGDGDMICRDKFSCRVLAGMRTMQERQASLKAFKEGEIRILVATDLAARGIDICELPFVVNMTLPEEPATYVHRIGRAGRAGKIGLAVSIVGTEREYVWWCQKGLKPPQKDTAANGKWHSETDLLKRIDSLLRKSKVNVTKLSFPQMNVPADMAVLINGKCYGDFDGESSVQPELKDHLDELRTTVNELSVTEFALQNEYWKLKNHFSRLS